LTGRGQNPSWSPDGERLLFARAGRFDNQKDLWIFNQAGERLTKISSFKYGFLNGSADWSPDGTSVVLNGSEHRHHGIYVSRLIGTHLGRIRQISTSELLYGNSGPVWSPTAPEIAFVRFHGETEQLAVMSTDGGRVHVISTGALPGRLSGPSWSPDGKLIAFIRCDRLSVIRPDGSGLHDLMQRPAVPGNF
jgi:Tol biopolymer transport system component